MAPDPLDPRSVSHFIDIEAADNRLIEKFTQDYPDLRSMVIHKVIHTLSQEVTFEVTIFLPGEIVTHKATVPMYQISPINKEPD